MTQKFQSKDVCVTSGAVALLNGNGVLLMNMLARHFSGDWGTVDDEDKAANDYALEHGQRLLSAYRVGDEKMWVITEWDRSVTTVLTPDEY